MMDVTFDLMKEFLIEKVKISKEKKKRISIHNIYYFSKQLRMNTSYTIEKNE